MPSPTILGTPVATSGETNHPIVLDGGTNRIVIGCAITEAGYMTLPRIGGIVSFTSAIDLRVDNCQTTIFYVLEANLPADATYSSTASPSTNRYFTCVIQDAKQEAPTLGTSTSVTGGADVTAFTDTITISTAGEFALMNVGDMSGGEEHTCPGDQVELDDAGSNFRNMYVTYTLAPSKGAKTLYCYQPTVHWGGAVSVAWEYYMDIQEGGIGSTWLGVNFFKEYQKNYDRIFKPPKKKILTLPGILTPFPI